MLAHVGGLAMSALSSNLHQSIRRALNIARDYHQGVGAPEHLLFALTDDPEATPVLLACNIDLAKLRDDLSTSLSVQARMSGHPLRSRDRTPRSKTSFSAPFVMSNLWITTR